MRDRRRSPLASALDWLLRILVLVLPLALVLWYFLVRDAGERPGQQAPAPVEPVRVPAGETARDSVPAIPTLPRPEPLPEPEGEPAPTPAPTIPTLPGPPPIPRPTPGPPAADRAPLPSPGTIAAIERRVAARLAADRPRTAPVVGPLRVRAVGIVLVDPEGRTVLRAAEATALLDIDAAYGGDYLLDDLVAVAPELYLERERADAPWNLERVLARWAGGDAAADDATGDAPDGPAERRIVVRDARVSDALIEVRTPEPVLFARDLDADIPYAVVSGPPERSVEVARLDAMVTAPQVDVERAVTLETAAIRLPEGLLVFEADRLASAASEIRDLVGTYRFDAAGLGLDVSLRAEPLAFADLRFLVPDLPAEGSARFGLRIEPGAGTLSLIRVEDLDAEADGSRILGSLELTAGGPTGPRLDAVDLRLAPLTIAAIERFAGPLPYGGSLTGRVRGIAVAIDFDVAGNLTTPAVAEPFRVELAGRASLSEEGFAIATLDADLLSVPLAALRPLAPGLPLVGVATGRISLRGPPDEVPLRIDLTLEVAAGVIALSGVLDLTVAEPGYDFAGRLVGIRVQEILEPAVPPVTLDAQFTLVGRGTDPARANARLGLTGEFSGWQAGPGDTILVRASVADGILTLDAAALSLASLDLSASGTWGLLAGRPGRGIDYRVALDPIAPFTPYLPIPGDGRITGALRTAGTLTGTLDRPAFTGDLEGVDLGYDGWSAAAVEARYAVTLGEPLPGLRLQLAARTVATPGETYDTVVAALTVAEPRFDFELLAGRDVDDPAIDVAADGRFEADGRREVFLRRLVLELADERWSLEEPAWFAWGDADGIEVRRFLLSEAEGEGRIWIDGAYPPTVEAGLRIEIAALPLGPLLALAGQDTLATGDLYMEIQALGPADSPRLTGVFRVDGGGYRGYAVSRLEGTVIYEQERLDARARTVLDTTGIVDLEASVPLRLVLEGLPDAQLLDTRPLRLALVADSLPLAAVETAVPQVRDAEGVLQARVFVTGSPERPRLEGAITLRDGAATIPALDQRYEEVSAEIELADDVAVVHSIRARSDGRAVASGTVRFAEPGNPTLDLLVEFDEFRAIGAEDREGAAVWGDVRIAGTLDAPLVTGDLTVNDGDVPVPTTGDGEFDEEIILADGNGFDFVAVDGLEGVNGIDGPPGDGAAPALLDRLRIEELILEFGDNTWFVTEEARVQLSGELVLEKPAEDLLIFGTLSGERGTFTLSVGPVVRRFEIVSATLRFFGSPEPDPAIEATASRVVLGPRGERTEILINVGGTLNAPTVAITTATGAPVPESELLSILLFGRPSFTLEEGAVPGQPLLEEALFGVGSLAELASIELEEALIADLGLPLDYFQIRPAPGPYAGFGVPAFAFGWELADDVFLSVDAGLATFFGPATAPATVWSATLEWRIDPEWTLVLGVEPVNTGRIFRGVGSALPVTSTDQQFIVELRRRWTY